LAILRFGGDEAAAFAAPEKTEVLADSISDRPPIGQNRAVETAVFLTRSKPG
jgi:hypothetical protein